MKLYTSFTPRLYVLPSCFLHVVKKLGDRAGGGGGGGGGLYIVVHYSRS